MSTPAALRQELRFTHLPSGARIAWARSGQGPALLRAGHWMTHLEYDTVSAMFRPWLERLGRSFTFYRYDERGCGLSGRDHVVPGLESSVEEIAAVVQAAGLPRVALLGISGGAASSIAYAARHPARVSHLVLLGGYSHGLLCRQLSAEQRAYLQAQAQLIELGWGVRDAPVQQFFTSTMIPDATPAQVAALNEQQRRSCDAARAVSLFRSRLTLDARADLGRVQCPTLVLHAEGDAAVNANQVSRWLREHAHKHKRSLLARCTPVTSPFVTVPILPPAVRSLVRDSNEPANLSLQARLPNGVTVELRGADPRQLGEVIQALGRLACSVSTTS